MNGFQNRGYLWEAGSGKRGYLWGVLMGRVKREFWEAGNLNLELNDGYMGVFYQIHSAVHIYIKHVNYKTCKYKINKQVRVRGDKCTCNWLSQGIETRVRAILHRDPKVEEEVQGGLS